MKTKNREKTRFGVLPGTISIQIREPGSAITHFVGLILVWIGAFPLMQRSIEHGSFITSLSMLVFIISTTLLYTASTLYHSVVLDLKKTMIFRKIDHTMISVLIAGTYTPVCLTALKGFTGYMLLTAIWALAIGGIFLKILFGGISYTLGAVIYAFKLKAFNEKHIYFGSHEIFHVFIMLGTFCHYMLLYTTLSFY